KPETVPMPRPRGVTSSTTGCAVGITGYPPTCGGRNWEGGGGNPGAVLAGVNVGDVSEGDGANPRAVLAGAGSIISVWACGGAAGTAGRGGGSEGGGMTWVGA